MPDNHIETARPQEFLAAFIRDTYDTDYPQTIIDVQAYARISRKTNASRPSRFYVQKGWPLTTINFESIPYADEDLHLFVLQTLAELLPAMELTDVINLPPGYRQALIYNLATVLAPEFGKTVTPEVSAFAINGKKKIKRANSRKIILEMDRSIVNPRRGLGTYIIEQGP